MTCVTSDYTQNQAKGTPYHDHAMGITRLNVYAGLAGFYLIRDPEEDGLNLPSGAYEILLMIQDRSFAADGSLLYACRRFETRAAASRIQLLDVWASWQLARTLSNLQAQITFPRAAEIKRGSEWLRLLSPKRYSKNNSAHI
jgi:FtsP/CotA-like multicopper oxidase with cupredoxin domain